MVEYAILVAQTSLATLQSFARSAEVWLSRLNWEVAAYLALALLALRIASWAFRHR
jgi:hypothetical protein